MVRRRKVRRVQAGVGSFEIAPAEVLDTLRSMHAVCMRFQQCGEVVPECITDLELPMSEAERCKLAMCASGPIVLCETVERSSNAA